MKRPEVKILVEKNKRFSVGSALSWEEVKPELLSRERLSGLYAPLNPTRDGLETWTPSSILTSLLRNN